ncbi:MAG TPA: DNA N-6-adenine-methyltransferase [Drouetiella sp.]
MESNSTNIRIKGSDHFRAGGDEGRPKATDSWRTPPAVFEKLDSEFHFVLDAACTSENCLAPNGNYFDKGIDGLSTNWKELTASGAIWLNPPYSNVRPWLEKAYTSECTVVFLITLDCSTKWWQECVKDRAAEVRMVTHRIKFLSPLGAEHHTKKNGGGTTTPSAIVIFRPNFRGTTSYGYISFKD